MFRMSQLTGKSFRRFFQTSKRPYRLQRSRSLRLILEPLEDRMLLSSSPSSITGRVLETGQWWTGASNGSSAFNNSLWASWNANVTWVDVVTGDFNGDGQTDVAARVLQTGEIWVALSNGSGFTTTRWTTWNPNVTWADVKVGDFTGDGKDDLVGRVAQTGEIWVATSTGSSFTNSLWTKWSSNAQWVDTQVGDFTGDGKAGYTARDRGTGAWWTGVSTGSSFTTSLWAIWNNQVTWVDLRVGNFKGDGKADIVGRVKETGQWWVGLSTGTSFAASLWATWSTAVTWSDVQVGDFNGDGKADITGRASQILAPLPVSGTKGESGGNSTTSASGDESNCGQGDGEGDNSCQDSQNLDGTTQGSAEGQTQTDTSNQQSQNQPLAQWWTGLSTGSSFTTTLWGTWNPNVTWTDVKVGDFNGDGRDDVVGRVKETGEWWMGQSSGSSFVPSLWTRWNPNVTWVDVLVLGLHHRLDTQPPTISVTSPATGLVTKSNVTVSGLVTDDVSGVASLQAQVDTGSVNSVTFNASGNFQFTTALALDGSADGSHTVHLTATDGAGNVAHQDFTFTLNTSNPAVGTAPLDLSVATTVGSSTQFLYTGSNPVQTGVAPGTINLLRAAVLRGKVQTADGSPLPGVTIAIVNHPEFGNTVTENNGMFDMAVNGGGLLTVNYSKHGYLNVQRQIQVPWEDYAMLPDVMMIQPDSQVTAIDLTANTPIQVARGSPVTDASGTRQATLMFAQGTHATMILADGTTQPLTTLHVRATEYTVGPHGDEAMPAVLPPNSAYTYAVELSADEAAAVGAMAVSFDHPVSFYVEDFLNFPVGEAVPTGFYDPSRTAWVASNNGDVLKIISITSGLADLDIDGSGQVATPAALAALGITDAERQQMASLYQPGQVLWRVPITHFSSWDCNWGFGPPPDAIAPDQGQPRPDIPQNNQCTMPGSIIGIQNQTLGEAASISGTPFSLHYQSDRQQSRNSSNNLEIPLSGAGIPKDVIRIDLKVFVAGQEFVQSFAAAPNLSTTFTWEGKDAYGRTLQGTVPATVLIGYVYAGFYQKVPRFGYNGNGIAITGIRALQEVTLWTTWQTTVCRFDALQQGLGGWGLNVLHTYDPSGRVLYLGDGTRRSADAVTPAVITTVAGGGSSSADGIPATQAALGRPNRIAVGPDGSLYFAEGNRVRRVGPDGIISTVAGSGSSGFAGDGGPATQALLASPTGVALGPDGSLYIGDNGNHRIRRVTPDGIISTVAGGGSGDAQGVPATQIDLAAGSGVNGLAVGPDGSLYISEDNFRVQRVGPDGIINIVAGGTATNGYPDMFPSDVAVGPDGSLYIADLRYWVIRRLGPDGKLSTVAGGGSLTIDGSSATQSRVPFPSAVAMASDGRLYIGPAFNNTEGVRRVEPDGIISTVAGNGNFGYSGDGGPATQAALAILSGVAVGPDGSLYFGDGGDLNRIRKVTSAAPGLSLGDSIVAAADGSELYVFNSSGRHLRTLDALTGTLRYQFSYDSGGRLTSVADADENITTIQRDAIGNPTAIVAPGGQVTTLTLDANGYLASISNPAGDTVQLGYGNGGLLATLTDPRGGAHHFSYDDQGRLTKDADPAGGFTTLTRTTQNNGYTVTLDTAGGMMTTHQVMYLPTGDLKRIDTDSMGLASTTLIGKDGSRTITSPDGTVEKMQLGPDPRFGMEAPVTSSLTVTTPSGLTSTLSETRATTLSDPNNPLSMTSESDTITLNGNVYTAKFDAASDTIAATTPDGRTEVTSLDSKGHVVEVQPPDVDPVQFTYDTHGFLITITQSGRKVSLAYDTKGNLISLTDPLSQVVNFAYDPAGRLQTQTLPDGSQIQYSYDVSGNLASLTPPGKPAHLFAYTPVDLLQTYTPPDVGAGATSTQYTYDVDRMLTQVSQPDGATIKLGYDMAGRLTRTTLTDAQGTENLGYDPQTGNLVTLTAPDGGKMTYGYDGSLLTDAAWSGTISGSVHYTFDNNSRVVAETVDGANPISFQFDKDGLLTQAGDLVLSRDAQSGRLTGTTLGTVTDSLTYDNFGAVTGYQASASGTSLYSVQDTFDALGRIIKRTETISGVMHTLGYAYDAAGRLTAVTQDGTQIAQYRYDANGNRLSFTGPGGTISGSYDNQDRLLQYGSTVYAYTANGEFQSKTDTATHQTTTYTYDALGNLLSVVLPDGTRIDYVIDAQNRRIGKKVNGTLMQGFLYDGSRVMAELDGSGNVVSRFVYAGASNVLAYLIMGGVEYRILTDQVGSPRLVVNAATGAVVERLDYDAFGNVATDTNPGFQPFGFASGLYDRDTGLIRFGARDYDTQTGRWTAKDPTRFQARQASLYTYAANDPVNIADPTGLQDATGPMTFQQFQTMILPLTPLLPLIDPASQGPGLWTDNRSETERINAEKSFLDAVDLIAKYPGITLQLIILEESAKDVNKPWKLMNALFRKLCKDMTNDPFLPKHDEPPLASEREQMRGASLEPQTLRFSF